MTHDSNSKCVHLGYTRDNAAVGVRAMVVRDPKRSYCSFPAASTWIVRRQEIATGWLEAQLIIIRGGDSDLHQYGVHKAREREQG